MLWQEVWKGDRLGQEGCGLHWGESNNHTQTVTFNKVLMEMMVGTMLIPGESFPIRVVRQRESLTSRSRGQQEKQ